MFFLLLLLLLLLLSLLYSAPSNASAAVSGSSFLLPSIGIIRIEVLRIQEKLLNDERLDSKGDIFHLNVKEIDDAIQNVNIDLMESIRPRKAAYERALRSTECPILVDSRCRILRPDPPTFKDGEEPPPGTLIGAAMAPGVAKGRVRIVNDPSETFLNGEVLCVSLFLLSLDECGQLRLLLTIVLFRISLRVKRR